MSQTHIEIENYVRLIWTDPASGVVTLPGIGGNEMIFSNSEINGTIVTKPTTSVQSYATEEGAIVTTATPRSWEWQFELKAEDPVTYQKLDLIVQFTGLRYSLQAQILTGFPIWNSTGDTMENVPGLAVIDPAVILWDDIDMREIVRGRGTTWRLPNSFRILQSVEYTYPGGAGSGGSGGGI